MRLRIKKSNYYTFANWGWGGKNGLLFIISNAHLSLFCISSFRNYNVMQFEIMSIILVG